MDEESSNSNRENSGESSPKTSKMDIAVSNADILEARVKAVSVSVGGGGAPKTDAIASTSTASDVAIQETEAEASSSATVIPTIPNNNSQTDISNIFKNRPNDQSDNDDDSCTEKELDVWVARLKESEKKDDEVRAAKPTISEYGGRQRRTSSSSSVSLDDVVAREGPNPAAIPADNLNAAENLNDMDNDGDDNDDSSEDVSDEDVEMHHTTTSEEEQSDSSHSFDVNVDYYGSDNSNESDNSDNETPEITHNKLDMAEAKELLTKPTPNYTWFSHLEMMSREQGLHGNNRSSYRNGYRDHIAFQSKIYSSRYIVEKMTLAHTLQKHNGCVNCLNFNRTGDMLVTGSDDLRIIIWDWAARKQLYNIKSGHSSNIFQTKFIDQSSGIHIVSSGRDGRVLLNEIPPGGIGTKINSRHLFKHTGAVHKLVLTPGSPFEIFSAGEDGNVIRYDLREEQSQRVATPKAAEKNRLRLFSISHHPYDKEFCVSGSDPYVRVYDKRNYKKPVHKMCPVNITDINVDNNNITCAVYDNTGTEILASYSDEHIYLFYNRGVYIPGQYAHIYKGHCNHKTIKGVNFFGPNSEYIISGSDCGNIFFWDKSTESILNFMNGDRSGVVNCLEPHPSIPVLATSGLDYNIKMWMPGSSTYPPKMGNLEKTVTTNLKRINNRDENEIFDDRNFFFFVRQFLRGRGSRGPSNYSNGRGNVAQMVESDTGDEDTPSVDGDGDDVAVEQLPCNPQ